MANLLLSNYVSEYVMGSVIGLCADDLPLVIVGRIVADRGWGDREWVRGTGVSLCTVVGTVVGTGVLPCYAKALL
ncbi:MAG: hypothetical protein VKK80_12810 [Prochlorothrix sp.]|nr:hypothetical protein [Prochlorothrix sp.]